MPLFRPHTPPNAYISVYTFSKAIDALRHQYPEFFERIDTDLSPEYGYKPPPEADETVGADWAEKIEDKIINFIDGLVGLIAGYGGFGRRVNLA